MKTLLEVHQNNPGSMVRENESEIAGNKDIPIPEFTGNSSKNDWKKDHQAKVSEENPHANNVPEAVVEPLSEIELKKREELELKVRTSETDGFKALAEIEHYEDGKLWKCEYSKFDEYAQSKFKFHKVHVNRLLESGRFLLEIENGDIQLPTTTRESHIRPIVQKLEPNHRGSFWKTFCETKSLTQESIGTVKAKEILTEVAAYIQDNPEAARTKSTGGRGNKGPTEKQSRKKALRLFNELVEAMENLPEYDDLKEGLEVIKDALNS